MRTRVWLVPYGDDWSYAFNARALEHELGDRFEIRIAYKGTPYHVLRSWRPHLAVDFWWRGSVRKLLPGVPVLRQVSSHRWQQPRYGSLDARGLVRRHLAACDGVLVPSMRLLDELDRAGAPSVALARKGFDPARFGDEQRRHGDLVVGWAGKASAADKNVGTLLEACPELRAVGPGTPSGKLDQNGMPDWYNSIDVITCASDAEGDPRTLIEGMACGCFPVTVDVGIVPELVRHGDNGLIVERTPEAFAAAFEWCRDNLEQVRAAGRRNAEQMLATRTWKQCAEDWAQAFRAVL